MEKSRRKLVSGRFVNSSTEGSKKFQPRSRPKGLSQNRFQSKSRMGRSASGEVASKGQAKLRKPRVSQSPRSRTLNPKTYQSSRSRTLTPKVQAKAAPQTKPQILKDLDRIKARGRGRVRVEEDIFPELPKQKSKPKPKNTFVENIPKNAARLAGRLGAVAGMLLTPSEIGNSELIGSEWEKALVKRRAKRSGSENKKVRRASSSTKTGVKSRPSATALSVGPAGRPSANKSRPKASVSAIPAKNRAKKSTVSSKPKTKMEDSVLRGTSRTPDSERAVKTVKTKGGDYKVYRKDSAAAKSFRQAFADARKDGKKVFTWNGRKYSTAVK